MSIESMAIALNHSSSSGTAKVVLLGIASHDGDGGVWPSVATLARYANVDARNVQRAIKRLEQLGEVHVFVQDGGTSRTPDHTRPNRYELRLRCPHTCDGTSQHRTRRALAGMETHPLAETSPGDASATPPLAAAPPEPSINQTPIETSSLNNEYQLGKAPVEVSNTPEDRSGRPASAPSYTDWKPAEKVAHTAAEKRSALRPAKAAPRRADEQALVDHFQGIECPTGAGLKHWLPPGLTECARGCGLDLIRQPELENSA